MMFYLLYRGVYDITACSYILLHVCTGSHGHGGKHKPPPYPSLTQVYLRDPPCTTQPPTGLSVEILDHRLRVYA